MAKTKKLIPAVGYLRKSTRGHRNGRVKQEKSIPQQKSEILAFAADQYEILDWYEDEGISGWKPDRPGFLSILQRARERGDFEAIVTDDSDRFTRAPWRKAMRAYDELADAGVQYLHCVKDGRYNIGDETDAGAAHSLLAATMANHEVSRRTSRRVTLARRNAALDGKRTGGPAPYGYRNDSGGLKLGPKRERDTVKFIFDSFVNRALSLHRIATELNARKIVTRLGKEWSVRTLAQLIRNPVYKGSFVFNRTHFGRFHGLDEQGELTDKPNGNGKVFESAETHPAIIEPKLFNKAQRRMEERASDRSRRKNSGYALTHVLKCGHCGSGLYASPEKTGGRTIYRCSRNSNNGSNSCKGGGRVAEEGILPFVVGLLGEELSDLREKLSIPPDRLRNPRREKTEQRNSLTAERERIQRELTEAVKQSLNPNLHKMVRQEYDRQVNEMGKRLEEIEVELQSNNHSENWSRDELAELDRWYDTFMENAVSIPLTKKGYDAYVDLGPMAAFFQDPADERAAILMDPLIVNECLLDLGCKVTLYWKSVTKTRKDGKPYKNPRHILDRGRFQLGQQSGKIPKAVLEHAVCR